ncbi:hypothetical protein L1887_13188 [Cichorium endivia]|nr:hypothetical protein L1887_13188 [Cichorium endivia]
MDKIFQYIVKYSLSTFHTRSFSHPVGETLLRIQFLNISSGTLTKHFPSPYPSSISVLETTTIIHFSSQPYLDDSLKNLGSNLSFKDLEREGEAKFLFEL